MLSITILSKSLKAIFKNFLKEDLNLWIFPEVESIESNYTSTSPQSIEKQTKNRNETGSDLSLGERLTRLSKRLSRKRCCDTTPDRCQEGSRLTILLRIVKKMLRLLPKPRVGGIPGPEAYQIKMIRPTSTLAP